MRVIQEEGKRGSLKWIQRAVNDHPGVLARDLLPKLGGAKAIDWRSPRREDDFAEYRDSAFLRLLGLEQWNDALSAFWPSRGPQWDALGVSDAGDILLVEAKAHVAEMCSPQSKASPESWARIEAALTETVQAFGATPRAPWSAVFYQLANRLAHLHFLRSRGVPARLILVDFVGDTTVKGPSMATEWDAAYCVANHVMGIASDARMMRYVLHVSPNIADLS
jgi:hypothetical protein